MAANQPPWGPGQGRAAQSAAGDRQPTYFGQPSARSRSWGQAIAVGLTAALAIAALIVAVTRPASQPSISTAPTPSASETAAAQRQLCDTYKLAARAVEVDTGGNDRALARIATTNGAVMLDNAIVPALDAKHRDAARALAGAYASLTAMSNNAVATDAQYQAALDDITAKDSVMKSVCANGGG